MKIKRLEIKEVNELCQLDTKDLDKYKKKVESVKFKIFTETPGAMYINKKNLDKMEKILKDFSFICNYLKLIEEIEKHEKV